MTAFLLEENILNFSDSILNVFTIVHRKKFPMRLTLTRKYIRGDESRKNCSSILYQQTFSSSVLFSFAPSLTMTYLKDRKTHKNCTQELEC